jgi:hypothetical protein
VLVDDYGRDLNGQVESSGSSFSRCQQDAGIRFIGENSEYCPGLFGRYSRVVPQQCRRMPQRGWQVSGSAGIFCGMTHGMGRDTDTTGLSPAISIVFDAAVFSAPDSLLHLYDPAGTGVAFIHESCRFSAVKIHGTTWCRQ